MEPPVESLPGPVRPRPGTALHLLGDDSAVVFNEVTQELFSFNRTAAYLWCRFEDGFGAGALAADLAARSGTDPHDAGRLVAACFADWRRAGLIDAGPTDAGPPPRAPSPPRATLPPRPAGPVPRPGPVVAERILCLPGLTVRLRYGGALLLERVQPVLAHLEAPSALEATLGAGVADTITVDLTGPPGAWTVRVDGRPFDRCRGLDEVAPLVKSALAVTLLQRARYGLALHAAAVTWKGRGRAVLLPGASGEGKTTLALALAAHGFRLLADDTVMLDTAARTVRGVPFRPAVKDGAWPVLQRFYPELDVLPVHRRPDGKVVRYLMPGSGCAPADGAAGVEAAWVVFPRYVPGEPTALRPLQRAEALRRLLAEAYAPSHRLGAADFAALAGWLRGLTCHELTLSSLDDAVAAVQGLVRGGEEAA